MASFDSLTSREEFRSTELGTKLIKNFELNDWLSEHADDGVLFIQGDREFLSAAYCKTEFSESNLKLVYVCTDSEFFTADGFRVSHKESGGVTDGE